MARGDHGVSRAIFEGEGRAVRSNYDLLLILQVFALTLKTIERDSEPAEFAGFLAAMQRLIEDWEGVRDAASSLVDF